MTTGVPALRLALVQMSIADGRPDENTRRALELLESADPADLYLLPELWTSGYAHASWDDAADRQTPEAAEALAELARQRGAWMGGSMITRRSDGALVNRLWLFPPDGGDPVRYDKGHLFQPMGEVDRLAAGTRRVRARIGSWTAGLSLCYDLRFPEMYRLDAVDGANLFLVAAEWPAERKNVLELLARARAAENQAYLALCNRAGAAPDGTVFAGGSMLVGPTGEVLGKAGAEEGVTILAARLEDVRGTREALEVLDRRRPGLDWA